jgi:hypothetical protein
MLSTALSAAYDHAYDPLCYVAHVTLHTKYFCLLKCWFVELFEAYDIDTTGTVTSNDFARIMHGLMGGLIRIHVVYE